MEGGGLDAVPPVVDHRHDVAQVQTLYHHLHEIFITARAGHKLIQGELPCRGGLNALYYTCGTHV